MTKEDRDDEILVEFNKKQKINECLANADAEIRHALTIAGDVATVDTINELAIALKSVDKAWELNQEQIEILKQESDRHDNHP